MKTYYRVMLGNKSEFAPACFAGNFIGTHCGISEDLTGKLADSWRAFATQFIPVYMATHPGKSKIAAGLACGTLWMISKGIKKGDIALCPDGSDGFRVGEVTGDYYYIAGEDPPHRRPVQWLPPTIGRSDMSDRLRSSTTSTRAGVVNLSQSGHIEEIERLMGGFVAPSIVAIDPTIEDPSTFAMEKHLEDFLVQNWSQTELGKQFDIFEEGDVFGQQYPTDTGPLDILAISKDKKQLLVVELKRGRASDVVVGQTLRYMGFVQQELAESGQTVLGAIIALDDDPRIRRALAMTPSINFYRYQISFKLMKV